MMITVPIQGNLGGFPIRGLLVKCPEVVNGTRCLNDSFRLVSLTPDGAAEPHTDMQCTRCCAWFCNAHRGLTCARAFA